jgi:2-polyprenyl-6-methoxyphenol hydroxylase-like FAD-dependent oxidoreductase
LDDRCDVLVVGAGPTGLAAGLFLAERRVRVRIIEKSEGPSTTSRAQVVNPRSLELLDSTGVTEAVLAKSHPIASVRFYENWRQLAEIGFAQIPSRFPMSVIPQAKTEALLAAALEQRGVQVERATIVMQPKRQRRNGGANTRGRNPRRGARSTASCC